MQNLQELWSAALAKIRDGVDGRAYDVWFRDITAESYDDAQKRLLLCVPSHYVCEYIEECRVDLMKEVLASTFGPGITLQYRIRREAAVQQPAVEIPQAQQIPTFSIPDARERLEKGLRYFLGDRAQWLPAYDTVAEWLSDNKGRGLLCVGTSGLGKTLICEKILPVIFRRTVTTVTATEMNARIDELLRERIVIIDGLGTEPVHAMVNYNRRTPFAELCDAAERNGILLIITTGLSTTPADEAHAPLYPDSIERRYGRDVLSRLRATTSVAVFEGEDMRG